MKVGVRFECGSEDRWTEDFGPFDYIQMTYTLLCGYNEDDHDHYETEIGSMGTEKFSDMWLVGGDEYSDMIMFAWEE
jgi:hypothetical protein